MQLKLIRPILFILVSAFVACLPTEEKESPELLDYKFQRIDSLIEKWNSTSSFNGNVLVAYSDSVFTKSRGYQRTDNSNLLEPNHIFYLGSLAKQFTGIAILKLVEEDNLDLDAKVIGILDSLPQICSDITIRHMLNHTSGLPDYYGMGIFKSGMTNEMVYQAMQGLEGLDFTPGSAYKYSNSAYVLLSMVVEKISGLSFREFLSERIFKPLEMDYTIVYDTSRPLIPNRALGHNRDGTLNDYNAFTTGGGGIFSNLDNLYKWVRALDKNEVVSELLMEESYKPVMLNDTTASWYGFGWRLDEGNSNIYQHSGSLAGYRTYMYRDTSDGTVILLLSNFTNNVSDLNSEILKILND